MKIEVWSDFHDPDALDEIHEIDEAGGVIIRGNGASVMIVRPTAKSFTLEIRDEEPSDASSDAGRTAPE